MLLPSRFCDLKLRCTRSRGTQTRLNATTRDRVKGERLELKGPPEKYSLREAAYALSHAIVSAQYPSLQDLVENGSLVVYEKSVEGEGCRTDGYCSPKRVFLLGTCHMSNKSATDVRRLIEAVQPENVVVEVCRSRLSVLYTPADLSSEQEAASWNPLALSGSSYGETLLRTLRLGGPSALAIRILMGSTASRISQSFKVRSGLEMRAAQEAAEEIDAQVVLGDRPIEITLKRAVEALSFSRKAVLLYGLVSGLMLSGTVLSAKALDVQQQIENMDEDLVTQWTHEVTSQFPELASPLLHERDLYLAWSMKWSKAVDGTKSVVGVIGRGHLRGAYYALHHDRRDLSFEDLVGKKQTPQFKSVGLKLAMEVAIGLACYFAWTSLSNPPLQSIQ